jgi:UDP-perosamine 4-acetyltransferase
MVESGNIDMKKEIIVVGAGGHAKVCIELLQAMGNQVAYCVGGADSQDQCVGVPVLKGDENLLRLRDAGYSNLFVAIGSNRLRERLASLAIEQGYELVNAISPHSIISPTVQLGSGIAIMAGAIINAEAVIADLAIINTGATIDHDCRIGKAAHIGPQCGLAGNVAVGGQSFLGIGCKVIPEVSIGENVIIGAGGVVISDVNSGVTAVGVPARVVNQ